MSVLTQKGQVTIPKAIRDVLGLQPGTEVEFVVMNGMVMLRKKPSSDAMKRWRGYLKNDENHDTASVMRELRDQ